MGDPGETTNPKLRTKLSEYGKRRKNDGVYADNLEVDALVVGGGFGGVFCFWSLRKEGLKTVIYEAGTDLGGTWRWNCYRKYLLTSDKRAYPDDRKLEPWWILKSPSTSCQSLRHGKRRSQL